MNKKDLKIISHLRQNARVSLTTLSRQINIPVSTIFDRIKNNEDGFIVRYTSLIDFNKLGYAVRANIALKSSFGARDGLKEVLKNHSRVNTVYSVSGNYDFIFEALFKNLKELEEFISSLEQNFDILEKNVYFIVDELKREAFLSDPNKIEIMLE